ncbi:hypothetical protein [Herbaspirillum sp. YR522]|uniref:hypothetical protein n=1 Tax=Herbaspirillum sp. YR522 TaxID=1144342 RepID=UPI000686765D|nr:hypothetical protein [Herbaspirillum sp. YR522]
MTITEAIRKLQVFVVDLVLTVAGLIALIAGLLSIFRDNAALTASCIGAGIILLFASTLHRFELLKGFGIEAKIRKLDDTIDKAQIALDKLRDVTELTLSTLVSLRTGDYEQIRSLTESAKLSEAIRSTLQGLQTDGPTIRRILWPWVTFEVRSLAGATPAMWSDIVISRRESESDRMKDLPDGEERQRLSTMLQESQEFSRDYIRIFSTCAPDKTLTAIDHSISEHPLMTESDKRTAMDRCSNLKNEIRFLLEHQKFRDIEYCRSQLPYRQ